MSKHRKDMTPVPPRHRKDMAAEETGWSTEEIVGAAADAYCPGLHCVDSGPWEAWATWSTIHAAHRDKTESRSWRTASAVARHDGRARR